MIRDKELILADGQALTASAASENVIDKTVAGALGKDLWLVVRCGTLLDSAGDAATTLDIKVQTDTVENFASPTDLVLSPQIAEASITANKELWKVKLPKALQRFVRVYFTVGTEDFTGGTIDAFLTPDVEVRDADA